MLIKTIFVPIYEINIQIHDNLEALGFEKDAPLKAAVYWDWEKDPMSPAKMGFNLKHTNGGVISHECAHMVFRIFGSRGVIATPDNDEHFTYLLEWLVNQVSQTLLRFQRKNEQKRSEICQSEKPKKKQ